MKGTTLVIAPHPDDEVLGAGGTIARLVEQGNSVFVAILTKGYPPEFSEESVQTARQEAQQAHQLLGVKKTFLLDFPAAALDTVPHRTLNRAVADIYDAVRPELVFTPFPGDIHRDHQLAFDAVMVGARPTGACYPRAVYAYETLSETNWNAPYVTPSFTPNVYVDISAHLPRKIHAMQTYASQVRPFPHERSAQALEALATLRGGTVGVRAAEGFVLVRQIL